MESREPETEPENEPENWDVSLTVPKEPSPLTTVPSPNSPYRHSLRYRASPSLPPFHSKVVHPRKVQQPMESREPETEPENEPENWDVSLTVPKEPSPLTADPSPGSPHRHSLWYRTSPSLPPFHCKEVYPRQVQQPMESREPDTEPENEPENWDVSLTVPKEPSPLTADPSPGSPHRHSLWYRTSPSLPPFHCKEVYPRQVQQPMESREPDTEPENEPENWDVSLTVPKEPSPLTADPSPSSPHRHSLWYRTSPSLPPFHCKEVYPRQVQQPMESREPDTEPENEPENWDVSLTVPKEPSPLTADPSPGSPHRHSLWYRTSPSLPPFHCKEVYPRQVQQPMESREPDTEPENEPENWDVSLTVPKEPSPLTADPSPGSPHRHSLWYRTSPSLPPFHCKEVYPRQVQQPMESREPDTEPENEPENWDVSLTVPKEPSPLTADPSPGSPHRHSLWYRTSPSLPPFHCKEVYPRQVQQPMESREPDTEPENEPENWDVSLTVPKEPSPLTADPSPGSPHRHSLWYRTSPSLPPFHCKEVYPRQVQQPMESREPDTEPENEPENWDVSLTVPKEPSPLTADPSPGSPHRHSLWYRTSPSLPPFHCKEVYPRQVQQPMESREPDTEPENEPENWDVSLTVPKEPSPLTADPSPGSPHRHSLWYRTSPSLPPFHCKEVYPRQVQQAMESREPDTEPENEPENWDVSLTVPKEPSPLTADPSPGSPHRHSLWYRTSPSLPPFHCKEVYPRQVQQPMESREPDNEPENEPENWDVSLTVPKEPSPLTADPSPGSPHRHSLWYRTSPSLPPFHCKEVYPRQVQQPMESREPDTEPENEPENWDVSLTVPKEPSPLTADPSPSSPHRHSLWYRTSPSLPPFHCKEVYPRQVQQPMESREPDTEPENEPENWDVSLTVPKEPSPLTADPSPGSPHRHSLWYRTSPSLPPFHCKEVYPRQVQQAMESREPETEPENQPGNWDVSLTVPKEPRPLTRDPSPDSPYQHSLWYRASPSLPPFHSKVVHPRQVTPPLSCNVPLASVKGGSITHGTPVSSAPLKVCGPTQPRHLGCEGPMCQTTRPQPHGKEGAPMGGSINQGAPLNHPPQHLGKQKRGGRAGLAPVHYEYCRRMPPSGQSAGGGSQPSGYLYSHKVTAPQITAAPGGFTSRYPHQQRRLPALYEQRIRSQQIPIRENMMLQQMHGPTRLSAFSLGQRYHVHPHQHLQIQQQQQQQRQRHHCSQIVVAYLELQRTGENLREPIQIMTSFFRKYVTVPRHHSLPPPQHLGPSHAAADCESGSACPLPSRPNRDPETMTAANLITGVPPIRAVTVSRPIRSTRRSSGPGTVSFRLEISMNPKKLSFCNSNQTSREETE